MASIENLEKLGWFVTPDGFKLISKDNKLQDSHSIINNACDIDIKEFGRASLGKDLEPNLQGPIVLQIQKIRNISAPKSNENSGAAPRLLKLILSDGHTTWQAIENDHINELNLSKTYPGTKILINNAAVVGSYILLSNKCFKVLGGNVPALIERWNLARSNKKHVREGLDGPPPWVPFGQRVLQAVVTDRNFKSLELKDKEQSKDEFNAQREGAIAEATLQGAVKKTFGGGIKPLPSKESQRRENKRYNKSDEPPKQNPKPIRNERRKGSTRGEKEEGESLKPSGRVSLFDFLEDKLPVTSIQDTEKPEPARSKPSYSEKYDANVRHTKPSEPPKSAPQKPPNRDKREPYNKPTKNFHDKTPRNERPPRFQRQQPAIPENPIPTNHFNNTMKALIQGTSQMSLNQNQSFNRGQNFTPKTDNFSQFGYNSMPKPRTDSFNKSSTTQNVQKPNSNYNNASSNVFNNGPNIMPGSQFNKFENVGNFNSPRSAKQPSFTNTPSNSNRSNTNESKWNVGDMCLAKYWEDNQYYTAYITGITARTCVVMFKDYGNFEEVLKEDCRQVSNSSGTTNTNNSSNSNFSGKGSMVFRRGGNTIPDSNRPRTTYS